MAQQYKARPTGAPNTDAYSVYFGACAVPLRHQAIRKAES